MKNSFGNRPIISVIMITYGHEKYIREAIEGVLMQKCNFEVELILANDCSPDQTDKVIRDILENHPRKSWIKYFKHKKNLGMSSNFNFAIQQSQGNYIALCEGDDYWTDALKLQKQVDFLEKNSQASGCFHNASLVDENSEILEEIYNPFISKFEFYDQKQCLTILQSSYATCSLVFRRDVLDNISKSIMLNLCDELLDLVITEKGFLCFMNFNGSNYRFHSGGIWSGNSEIKNTISVYKRTEILFRMFSFKQKYKKELENRHFLLANILLFSKEIRSKVKLSYFFNVLKYLNYRERRTYSFIKRFLLHSILNSKGRISKLFNEL